MTDFETVYRQHFGEVELYLLSLCSDPTLAQELTAQTFFQAMEALPKYRGDASISTWLCAIAKNCYLTHLRKRSPEQLPEGWDEPDTASSPEELLTQKDQAMEIHRALHSLPEPYKEVFSLRVLGELSFGQIGSLFGKTQNWACVTYHRAKDKIKEILEE